MLKNSKKLTALLLVMVLTITSILGMGSNSFAAEAVNGVIYQSNGCEVQFKVNSQWETGFEEQFIVINNSDKPLENWRIRLKFGHEITSIWDGELESHTGNVYVIKHPGWNPTISAGGRAVVGFNGKSNGTVTPPSDCTVPGGSSETSKEDYTITYRTTSDWSDAFNGEISITNHTKKAMENWQLAFDFEKDITQLWNAKLVKHQGNHYIIKHDGWNSVIKAGATIKFGFEGKTGNVTTEPVGYKLTKSNSDVDTGGQEIEYDSTDPDGDGLIGEYEKLAGSDNNKKDTDEDGLDDWFEYMISKTNANKKDTNGNGVSDGEEDFDSDGLNNMQECIYYTDPHNPDTDGDSLTDKEEIEVTKTNPLVFDTDGDRISDGAEIKVGLNPLNKYTHAGVLDTEYVMTQTLDETQFTDFNKDNPYTASAIVKAAGYAGTAFIVEESGFKEMVSDNEAVVGSIFSFRYHSLFKMEQVVLKFKMDETILNETLVNYPDDTGLKGIKRYQIFHFDKNSGAMYPLETEFEEQTNTLSAITEEEGDYCVIDLDQLLYSMGAGLGNKVIKPEASSERNNVTQVKISSIETGDKQVEDDILPDNYNKIVQQKIDKVCGNLERTGKQNQSQVKKKPVDIVYIIDTSKSMEDEIQRCKNGMESLVMSLYEEGIDARITVLSFDDKKNEIKEYRLKTKKTWGTNAASAKVLIDQVNVTNGKYENCCGQAFL